MGLAWPPRSSPAEVRLLRTCPVVTFCFCLSRYQLVDFSIKKKIFFLFLNSNRSSCYISLSPDRTFCYKKIEGYFRKPKGLENDWNYTQGSCQNRLAGSRGHCGTVSSSALRPSSHGSCLHMACMATPSPAVLALPIQGPNRGREAFNLEYLTGLAWDICPSLVELTKVGVTQGHTA